MAVALWVPVTSPDKLPLKLVAEATFVAVVAVVALPESVAVIVPAVKLPLPSRFTMALAVFALVAALASTAPAATLAAVCAPTVDTTVAD